LDFDVVILGGGAAGLMAAARLNELGITSVCVIEGNAKVGAKIRISGGGKCNLTNAAVSERNYLGNESLVREVLGRFDRDALLQWVRSRGCKPVLRKERYYFCPHSAQELIDLLVTDAGKTHFMLRHHILKVDKSDNGFAVLTDKTKVTSRNVIVATGGASYASVGASDIGLKIARSFGIETVPFRPALAGLAKRAVLDESAQRHKFPRDDQGG